MAITKVQGKTSLWAANAMSISGPVEIKGKLYCVYLCNTKRSKILAKKTESKKEALKFATDVADYLKVPLRNYIKELLPD